jgi:hypothetical protein
MTTGLFFRKNNRFCWIADVRHNKSRRDRLGNKIVKAGQGSHTEFVRRFCLKFLAQYPFAKVISRLAGLTELSIIGMSLAQSSYIAR